MNINKYHAVISELVLHLTDEDLNLLYTKLYEFLFCDVEGAKKLLNILNLEIQKRARCNHEKS